MKSVVMIKYFVHYSNTSDTAVRQHVVLSLSVMLGFKFQLLSKMEEF